MKIAFLFAGQGSQRVGMGLDIYENSAAAKNFLDQLKLDFDLKKLIFEDPLNQLNQTEYTQIAILCTSLMIAEALKEQGIRADVCAGLSLGEYSALTYAEAFALEDVLPLVQKRGLLMANALPKDSSGMVALLSSDVVLIQSVLNNPVIQALGIVDIANYNSPKQTVISGEKAALEAAVEQLQALGIRTIALNVSGAFHSRLLKPSSQTLSHYLDAVSIQPTRLPVFMNVSGTQEVNLKDALVRQIFSSVQWVETLNQMVAAGVTHMVEIGPGKTLSKFIQAMNLPVKLFTVDSYAELITLKGELHA